MDFENFLRAKHLEQFKGGKDEIPDDFNWWLDAELEFEDIIKYADEWGKKMKQEFKEIIENKLEKLQLDYKKYDGDDPKLKPILKIADILTDILKKINKL